MSANTRNQGGRHGNLYRTAIWGTAALMLLVPAVAMQFSAEMNWGLGDFALFGAMLLVACGTYELAAWVTARSVYRAGIGLAIAAAFFLVWAELAVGLFD